MEINEENKFHDPKNSKHVRLTVVTSPTFNKGTAFSSEERRSYGLRGLLPHRVETLDNQIDRVYEQVSPFIFPTITFLF